MRLCLATLLLTSCVSFERFVPTNDVVQLDGVDPKAPPRAPTDVVAVASDGNVNVSWPAVPGATSYVLYWAVGSNDLVGATRVTDVTSPYSHTGLTNGATYYYALAAVNGNGEGPASDVVSASPAAPPPPLPPLAPTNLQATPSDGSVLVSWIGVDGAASYNLYWSTSSAPSKTSGTKLATVTTPHTHSGLTNGTTYYYVVTAVGPGGESNESASASATPQLPPPVAPAAPTILASDGSLNIVFSSVPNATSYDLYWATAPGVTPQNGTLMQNVTSPQPHTSLTNATRYYYVLVAKGPGGQSPPSSEASAKPCPVLPVPAGLTPTLLVSAGVGTNFSPDASCIPVKTISEANTRAIAGDIIFAAPGTYDAGLGETFPIQLKSGVTLIGDEPNRGNAITSTIVTGDGNIDGFLTAVFLPQDNTTIAGFKITNTGAYTPGVKAPMGIVIKATGVTLRRNLIISNARNGVYVARKATDTPSSSLSLIDNDIKTNGSTGVAFFGGGHASTLRGNIIWDNAIGVSIDPSPGADPVPSFNDYPGLTLGDGSPASPGGNKIYCNSTADLWTTVASGAPINAQNNTWDHNAPFVISYASCSGNQDICQDNTLPVSTTGAIAMLGGCF
ncbi:MAG: DUF1565 domain-containing protein [Deltaproteobacteria bacterium]|nr:DUF1565 domain-containing protein [Deltaproteobacteria bacterium]